MVLVFLKKKIMCCAVIRSGNFKMLVLLYQLLIGQSLAQLVERCTSIAEGVGEIPYKQASDLLDGFSIGRQEKKSESFDIFAAKF